MTEQLDLLKQLQQRDGDIYRLRRLQEDKPHELKAVEAQLADHEARLKAVEERLTSLQLLQKQKDVELQTGEEKVRKLQGQLFQVKTNKEYTAIQHEIGTLRADNSLLEESILQLLDAIDQTTKERQQARGRLSQLQERLHAERARIERELAEIHEQMARLERERQALAPGLPPETLSAYERVLKSRDGLALVPLVNESCGGCHRRLPPQVINEVYLKARLVTCEVCNRILYSDAQLG